MKEQNYINEIIEKIMEAANLKGLPEAQEEQFKKDLEAQFTRRLGLIVIKNLDDEGLEEYQKMIDSGDIKNQEKFNEFISRRIPDYGDKVKEEMNLFVSEVLAAAMR